MDNEITRVQNNLPSMGERLEALKLRAAKRVEIKHWKPIVGDTIAGVIKGSDVFSHPLYGDQKTMLVQGGDGSLSSVILSKYLLNGLSRNNAEIGDLIVITFIGKKQSPAGHSFNEYSLAVGKSG